MNVNLQRNIKNAVFHIKLLKEAVSKDVSTSQLARWHFSGFSTSSKVRQKIWHRLNIYGDRKQRRSMANTHFCHTMLSKRKWKGRKKENKIHRMLELMSFGSFFGFKNDHYFHIDPKHWQQSLFVIWETESLMII